MSTHLTALKEDISDIVLMPGDPKRCEFIANKYLTDVKLVSDVRNMNAYTGFYQGKRISLVPSGMGMPSLAIYAHELYTFYNVNTIIRIGTCGTFNHQVFDVILANEAITKSNFAFEYNKSNDLSALPTPEINEVINQVALTKNVNLINGSIFTNDAFYESDNKDEVIYDGVEMETFALFYIAESLHKKAAALLTVSNVFDTDIEINAEEREKGLSQMIELALESILKL